MTLLESKIRKIKKISNTSKKSKKKVYCFEPILRTKKNVFNPKRGKMGVKMTLLWSKIKQINKMW
jgi:hypothetical protein